MSVNLSRIDLFDPELPAKLDGLRKKYRLPGQLLDPFDFAHLVGFGLEQVVHGAQVRAGGFRVGLRDLGQQVARTGDSGQLTADQTLDGPIDDA